jgi:hypothetical protein
MNKTETKAYNWLLQQGIPKESIFFQRNKSPDFIIIDRNEGYEAKRLYGKKILIDPKQFNVMKQQMIPITILVFSDEQNEPIAKVPFKEINQGTEKCRNTLIEWVSYNSIEDIRMRVKKVTK